MSDFTNEEKQRIDLLYGSDFESITPDDVLLIARWEQYKAKQDEEHRAKIDAIKAETDVKLANAREEHQRALSNLEELKNAALERLEMIANVEA